MKIKTYMFVVLLGMHMVSCFGVPIVEVEVMVVNEDENPVSNAEVTVFYSAIHSDDSTFKRALTNSAGRVVTTGETYYELKANVKKDGYYMSLQRNIGNELEQLALRKPFNKTAALFMLRKQLNPVPLYVKQITRGGENGVKVPAQNKWIGFDFEVGDWVKPYGKGEVSDFLLKYENEFLGMRASEETLKRVKEISDHNNQPWNDELAKYFYGKWKANFAIRFTNEDEGFIGVTSENGYLAQSEMKLPHFAPESGYQPEKNWENVEQRLNKMYTNEGYFFRTRVVKDEEGKIISANYAKMNRGFTLDPRGEILFTYYYNPEPNNRNLEWDTEKNLFKKLNYDQKPQLLP